LHLRNVIDIRVIRLTRSLFFSFLFLLYFVPLSSVSARVMINEFSSGSSSDWVEIINTGTESAGLSVYILRDSTSRNHKDLDGELGAGQIRSFSFSNYLNNDGDTISLTKPNSDTEVVEDTVSYGLAGGLCASGEYESIGRKPDGSGNFVRFSQSSRDSSNNENGEALCMTPSPTPLPTHTSTPLPTAPHTPKPTSTPISTKTPIPAYPDSSVTLHPGSVRIQTTGASVLVAQEEELIRADEDILGIETVSSVSGDRTTRTPATEATVASGTASFPVFVIPLACIGGGLAFFAFGFGLRIFLRQQIHSDSSDSL
jgi:hypothetical protein